MAAAAFDLRARLATGGPFLFSWATIGSAQLAGQLARLPFDGVCLDLQHGMIGPGDAASMIAAIAAAGRPAIARVLWNDPGLVGQALDMGASAVIAPMVNSRAEAEALVRAAKYPPLGGRSWGGYTALQTAGVEPSAYLSGANRMTFVFAMIETAQALERVFDIAAKPGLDGLFVGPSDLSIALSQGAKIDRLGPGTRDAMARVAEAAKLNSLVAGAFAGTAEAITAYGDLGYTFLAAAVDVDLLSAGVRHFLPQPAGV